MRFAVAACALLLCAFLAVHLAKASGLPYYKSPVPHGIYAITAITPDTKQIVPYELKRDTVTLRSVASDVHLVLFGFESGAREYRLRDRQGAKMGNEMLFVHALERGIIIVFSAAFDKDTDSWERLLFWNDDKYIDLTDLPPITLRDAPVEKTRTWLFERDDLDTRLGAADIFKSIFSINGALDKIRTEVDAAKSKDSDTGDLREPEANKPTLAETVSSVVFDAVKADEAAGENPVTCGE